jgi:hypothetical protein
VWQPPRPCVYAKLTALPLFAVQLVITVGIYYKFGYAQPLLIQSVMQPMNLIGEPLVQIHFLGKDDTVEPNKRPFKADKPPGACSGCSLPNTLVPTRLLRERLWSAGVLTRPAG